jgi:hypothetical protein
MESGRFRTISIMDAVANAKEDLNIEVTNEHDGYLLKKANEALLHIQSIDQAGKYSGKFDIVDGRVCLPNGLTNLLGFVFLGDDDCPVLFGNLRDTKILTLPVGFNGGWGYHVIPNDGGVLVFDCANELPGERVRLFWEGRMLDEAGLSVMHELEERGVAAYCCWKFSQRFSNNYGRDVRNEWKRDWENQKRFLKSNAIYSSWVRNRNRIQALMSSYLVFKGFGQT